MRRGRCSATTTDTPEPASRSHSRRRPSAPSASSWDVGSSSTSSRGVIASAEARATRWRWPPDRVAMRRFPSGEIPITASASSTRWRIEAGGSPRFSGPKATSRRTVARTNWASGSWKTRATWRASCRVVVVGGRGRARWRTPGRCRRGSGGRGRSGSAAGWSSRFPTDRDQGEPVLEAEVRAGRVTRARRLDSDS